jgi:DNA-binding SARP family transcriptional activator
VEVESDDGRVHTLARRQERCTLAILLLEAGRVVHVDRLTRLLWDDDPPPQARRAVQAHIARIRAVLSPAGSAAELVSHRDGYELRVDTGSVDVHRFRDLFERATRTADLAGRDRLLREALALWRGPALHNAASERLRERLCANLDEQHLQALEASIATGLDLGRHDDLLPELARLGTESPIRERLVELHMLALYRQGRTTEALDVHRHARARLAGELGREPGPALQRLHRAILRGDPMPAAHAVPPQHAAPAQLPRDVPDFHGRAAQLDQLDALLTDGVAAAVISAVDGSAGVGRTALAVHWAHRVRDRFPDGQLYVSLRGDDPAGTPVPPGHAIRTLLGALRVAPQHVPADLDSQIGLYRSILAGRRVLIVLDDARDPDQVRPLLPGAPGCRTVVTSRNQLTGLVAIDGALPVPIGRP